jgi:hypothetical protein
MEVEAGRAAGEELVETAGKDIKARNTAESVFEKGRRVYAVPVRSGPSWTGGSA